MTAPVLDIEALSLSYRTRNGIFRALTGAGLTVGRGEAVGLVGESGSGKSTLARACLGLLPAGAARIEAGRIAIEGRDVTGLSERAWTKLRGAPVAMVFQDPMSFLNPVMRVGRQIAEGVRLHTPELPADRRVAELIERVRLPASSARAFPHELSGGMRQRALIAIALACRPRLLIADEPTTALDVTTQAEILALLGELRRELSMALLLISHDLGVIASACERVYVMYAGRTVEWGPSAAVLGAPAHPYTEGLIGAAGAERGKDGRFVTIAGDPPGPGTEASGCPFRTRCPLAMPDCAEAMPEPGAVRGDASHQVRCFAVGRQPPASRASP